MSSQRSVEMNPAPQSAHSSATPSPWTCSLLIPASIFPRTIAIVSVIMRWYVRRSSTEESGPCPGMMRMSAGTLSSTSEIPFASPSTLPPLSMSTKGKRPAKKSSPMWRTFEPVK